MSEIAETPAAIPTHVTVNRVQIDGHVGSVGWSFTQSPWTLSVPAPFWMFGAAGKPVKSPLNATL